MHTLDEFCLMDLDVAQLSPSLRIQQEEQTTYQSQVWYKVQQLLSLVGQHMDNETDIEYDDATTYSSYDI